MRAAQYNRAVGLTAAAALFCLLSLSLQASELTPAEYLVAARVTEGVSTRSKGSAATTSTKITHPLGVQTLSIEADWKKHTSHTRLARIYQYDHSKLQSRLLVVDVNTQQVIHQHLIDSAHLPLSDEEISYATALLNNSNDMLQRINQQRTLESLVPLTDLTSFDAKASIYEPLYNDHLCSHQRCVLFALVDETLTVSRVEPVVVLSSGAVRLLQSTLRD